MNVLEFGYTIIVFCVFAVAKLSFINDQKDSFGSFSQQIFVAFLLCSVEHSIPLN